MSVSPDEFLRYLIDSGAFNQYNQQAIHALPIPKNDLSAVVLPAVSGGVDSDVSSWEYYQAHKKEIGEEYFDYLADLNAKGIISYPNEFLAWYSTQMQPYPLKTAFDDYRNCRASDNPYTAAYGGDAYLAWNSGWRPESGISAVEFIYGKPVRSDKAAQANARLTELANQLLPTTIPDLVQTNVFPSPIVGLKPIFDTADQLATWITNVGRPQVEKIGLNPDSFAGQVLSGVIPSAEIAALLGITIGGGYALSGAAGPVLTTTNLGQMLDSAGSRVVSTVKNLPSTLSTTVTRSAKCLLGRSIVMSFVGAAGGLVNAYFSQTKEGRPAKTWLNKAGTVEYSNVPAEGFKKSKYPDKFGQICYYRKVTP